MRSRTVECIVYQENCSSGAVGISAICESLGCDWILSPLHNADRYEDDKHKGELKKAHWHLLLKFKNARQFGAVAKDLSILGVVEQNIAPVHSWNRAVRYLAHLDEVDKVHYDLNEIRSNVKDWQKFLVNKSDKVDKGALISDLIQIIEDKNLSRFTLLVDEAKKLGSEYLGVCSQRAYFFVSYLKERKFFITQSRLARQALNSPMIGDYGYQKKKEDDKNKELEIF